MILGEPVFENNGPVYARFVSVLYNVVIAATAATANVRNRMSSPLGTPLGTIEGRSWVQGDSGTTVHQGAMLRRDENAGR